MESKYFNLVDAWSDENKHHDLIPLDRETIVATKFIDEGSWDFALMPMRQAYCNLLSKNDKIPITKIAWEKGDQEHEYYYTVGIPANSVKLNKANLNVTLSHSIKRFELLDSKPKNFNSSGDDKIFGKLVKKELASEIKGMSGGPVFGLSWNEYGLEVSYHLIGIQSTASDDGYISATKFIKIGEVVSRLDENLQVANEM